MALLDQRRTVRLPLPDLIVRDAAHTIYAPVYLDGALVAPSSGTVSVYNASNTAVVDGAAAVIASSIAEYDITSGIMTAETLGERWRVEWSLTMGVGDVITPRNDAALVRNALWPVVSDVDIIERIAALDTSAANSITSATNFQGELNTAWRKIQRRLIRVGNRPNLIMSPSDLAECHEALTLATIWEGRLASRLDPAFRQQYKDYVAEYEKCWGELNFRYDVDDDGIEETKRRAGSPTVWLNTHGDPFRYGPW